MNRVKSQSRAKPIVFVVLLFSAMSFVITNATKANKPRQSTTVFANHWSRATNQELQQLSASNHSTIAESFIFVARDQETYNLARAAISGLPEQPVDFFDSHVVVAVFLGQRPTGGYNIEITAEPDGEIRVAERKPPKGAILKMVLSAPHKVVAIPVKPNQSISFILDETWQQKLRVYNVSSGEVVLSRSVNSPRETYKVEGQIAVMRTESLATFFFKTSLSGSDNKRLFDVASGGLGDQNSILLKRVYAPGLSDTGQISFKAIGNFTDEKAELTLRFETINGQGSLSALASIKAKAEPSKSAPKGNSEAR